MKRTLLVLGCGILLFASLLYVCIVFLPNLSNPSQDKIEENSETKNIRESATFYATELYMSKKAIEEQLTMEEGFDAKEVEEALGQIHVDYKENALHKCKEYESQNLSKQGLYDVLTGKDGERFTKEEGEYAIEHYKTDYVMHAIRKAKEYLYSTKMTKDEIYTQLTSQFGDQFTKEEADAAILEIED